MKESETQGAQGHKDDDHMPTTLDDSAVSLEAVRYERDLLQADWDEMLLQNERLRQALLRIVEAWEGGPHPRPQIMVGIAKDALGSGCS